MTDAAALEGTHLERVYWPRDGYTKRDMLEYYERMAPYILPHLKDRPLVLKRFPRGIEGQSFFQKNVAGTVPGFVKRVVIRARTVDKDVRYVVCNNVETLLYLANLGTIELHPWASRLSKLTSPDFMILDLDPGRRTTYDMVVAVAQATRKLLGELGLPSCPKTSGKGGIHVYVPLGAKVPYDIVRDVARRIGVVLAARIPGMVTVQRGAEHRVGRIFVDYLRNSIGQTAVSPYSLRASERATVSAPLQWQEVKRGLRPEQFTIKTMIGRVSGKGDLFAAVRAQKANLQSAAERLERMEQELRHEDLSGSTNGSATTAVTARRRKIVAKRRTRA
jgi:bifunctional non-homologous end joining protein LigD